MQIEALKKFCDLVETESIALTADRNLGVRKKAVEILNKKQFSRISPSA